MTLARKEGEYDAHTSFPVVPAQAGTHTLRASDAKGIDHSWQQRAKQ
jgi:hypothetical protein